MAESLKAQRIRAAIEQGTPIDPLLKKDYVPGGETVRLNDLNEEDVEPVPEDMPLARCCKRTCYDIQSGPGFCGKPATTMIPLGDGQFIFFCDAHSLKKLKAEMRRSY